MNLSDVAGGAVDSHHLQAADLVVADGHPHGQAVRVVAARWIRNHAESLDVVEKRTVDWLAAGVAELLFEGQQPGHRKEFTAFGQVVVLLPFLGGQTIAARRRRRVGQGLRQILVDGP